MEGLAHLTIVSICVVLAVAHQAPLPVGDAAGSVTVALTAAPDGKVGQGVVVTLPGTFLVHRLVSVRVELVKDHHDVGGRHPVLQDGAVVEVVGGGPALQGAEGHPGPGQRVDVAVGLRAQGLLLVGLGDGGPRGLAVHLLAVAGVVLEGHPRLAVVHALVDAHGVGPGGAELQADVGQLVLLVQAQLERDVLRVLHERLGHPAGQVVGVVQVRQVGGRMATLGVVGVADEAVALDLTALACAGLAVPAGRRAARAGGYHFLAKGGVDEVRNAALGFAAVVKTRVGRRLLSREHVPVLLGRHH